MTINRFTLAFNEAFLVHSLRIELQHTAPSRMAPLQMHNLTFDFFDDSGVSRGNRILMFYSFETEDHLARSGILHYHMDEHRFVGPRHDRELTDAAMAFLTRSGRLPESNA